MRDFSLTVVSEVELAASVRLIESLWKMVKLSLPAL